MILKILVLLLVLLVLAYLLGPRPKRKEIDPSTPKLDIPLDQLDGFVAAQNAKITDMKPDNESRILWNDSTNKTKTPYVLLYLHGFTASHAEGDPINKEFGKRYGMNTYIPLLYQHGRKDIDAFKDFDNDAYFESAQQAYEIAKLLGEKVIIMSCSTGSTLAIMLAKLNPDIYAHIMYSPNIDLADPMSALVTGPWGKQLTEIVMNGDYNHVQYDDEGKKYWYSDYHIDGIIGIKGLINDNMTKENFKHIDQPLFMAYYYQDEEHQDNAVSVDAMLDFFDNVNTPAEKKVRIAFPDANTHVVSSWISNKNVNKVMQATYDFAENVLHLSPIKELPKKE